MASASLPTLIGQSARFVLISHIQPDGDAVGSLLGLTLALTQLGKEVTPVLVDGVPKAFQFLKGSEKITSEAPSSLNPDLCIVLDAPDLSRTGMVQAVKQWATDGKLACIDHHISGDILKISCACLHDETASSSSELVYRLLGELGVRIEPDIATALLCGIFTDTGGFQHSNTNTETLEVAAELMRRGAKLQEITRFTTASKTLASLKLLGTALERLRITCLGTCAVSVLIYKDLRAVQGSYEDIAGIIGTLAGLPEIEMALLLIEVEPGLIRGTMRTAANATANVSTLAKLLGGGGHPKAAGFSLPGLIEETEQGWRVIAKPEEKS